MDFSRREARTGRLLTAPAVLGCALFYGLPFLMVLRHAVTQGVGATCRFVGADNFVQVWNGGLFRLALWNTARFLLVGLPLILALSYAVALLLRGQVRRHRLLRSVLLFPYIMPVVGTVLLVELMFGGEGVLDRALMALGLPVADYLQSPASFWAVMALYLWKNTGYSVILLLSGLTAIPEEQYAAAELDGATGFQRFRYITTPQMWDSLFFAALFSMLNAFKCFREIFLIGGAHPHADIYMLQHYLYNSFQNLSYAKLSVASVVLLAAVTAAFGSLYRRVSKKEGSLE